MRHLPPTTEGQLDALFAAPLIWQMAADIPEQAAGRPRRHPLAIHLAYGAAARIYGSANRLDAELRNGRLWRTLRQLHNTHSPDGPLPDAAPRITADAYRYARDYLCSDEQLPRLLESFTIHSVAIARQVGLLDPNGPGSRTHPHPTRVIYGDGTIIRPLYGPTARRADPDAADHRRHDGTIHGNNLVALATRGPEPHRRVLLAVGRVDQPGREADTAIGLLRRLKPHVGEGAVGVVYDGAFRGVHHQTIMTELGLIPINKVHPLGNHDGDRNWRTITVGHIGHTVDGRRCVHNLVARNGAILEAYLDADSELVHSEPLPRRQIRRIPTKAGYRFSIGVDVPCPRQPFTTWISPHPRTGDRGYGRPDQIRLIPPDDPDFARLYGLRNDSESINARYKRTLYTKRAAGLGWRRQILDLLSWGIATNTYAWATHTGE